MYSRAFDATLRDRKDKSLVAGTIRQQDERGREEMTVDTWREAVRFEKDGGAASFEGIVREMSTLKFHKPTYVLLYTKFAMTVPAALSAWPKPSALVAVTPSHPTVPTSNRTH